MAFKRVIELYVGNFAHGNSPETKGTLVSDLDMEFQVERSVVWFENKAVFRLYNASVATVNQILVGGNSVVFRAGHEDEKLGTVWIGQIGYAWTESRGNDTVTTLICTNGRGGQYPLARVMVSLSFAAGTTMTRVLEDLAAYAGLSLGGLRNLDILGITLENPLVLVGDLRSVIRHLYNEILGVNSLSLYIDNNELLIYRAYGEMSELDGAYLDSSSGLISATPYRDEGKNQINYRQDLAYWSGYSGTMDSVTAAETVVKNAKADYAKASADAKADAQTKLDEANASLETQRIRAQTIKDTGNEPETAEEIQRRNTVKFKALLNPRIIPNSIVSINTKMEQDALRLRVRGTFRVEKVSFVGDNMGGDFHVEGEAYS